MVLAIASDRVRSLVPALIIASLAVASPALADPSAADKASAEALFEHGKLLMKDGRFAEACPKFLESQKLDSGIGTMLNLADCFEKNGQTASAWGEFLDAAAAAKAAGQPDREKKARERAAALEPRLSKLTVTVAAGAEVPGLEVKRDGAVLPKALWGTAVPVDPGQHAMTATAPGKTAWSLKFTLRGGEAAPMPIVVPSLEDAPAPPVVAPPIVAVPVPVPGPARPGKPDAGSSPLPAQQAITGPRAAGFTVLGLGLATASVGGILGMVALLKNSDASTHCRSNGLCDSIGVDARQSALGLARSSNITLIAGSAGFATGLIILLATRAPSETDRYVLQASPLIGSGTGGFALRGAF